METTRVTVDSKYSNLGELTRLADAFAEEDAVILPQFLTRAVQRRITADTESLRETMRSKSFTMPGFDTPRIMSVLAARDLATALPYLRDIYEDLSDAVSVVARSHVYLCQHERETMVLNRLDGAGRTHGWHVDDPAYAVVIVLRGVAVGDGGAVEYIRQWPDECRRRGLDPEHAVGEAAETMRAEGKIRTLTLRTGDAYLLRADTSLHRVTPITNHGATRLVLNFAYEAHLNTLYAGTADLLYA